MVLSTQIDLLAARVRDEFNEVRTVDFSSIKAGFNITGGGTASWIGGYLSWTQRLIAISNGNGSHFSTSGYFDITQPPNGTVIAGVGGHAGGTVTASGIPMSGWNALYYILPIGSGSASLPANFRLASYTGAMVVPSHWILVAVVNDATDELRLCNGVSIPSGGSSSAANPYQMYSLTSHTHAGVYEPVITAGTTAQYYRGDKTWQTLNFAALSGSIADAQLPSRLGVSNGPDQTDLNNVRSSGWWRVSSGTPPTNGPGGTYFVGLNVEYNGGGSTGNNMQLAYDVQSQALWLRGLDNSVQIGWQPVFTGFTPPDFTDITGVASLAQMPSAGTSAQYMRGDKTWQTLNAAAVGITTDAAAGTGSLRTLGTGALQAAAGNHGHALTGAEITGILPIAKGGNNGSATPTLGGVAVGTGTAYAFTAAGTAKQVLASNGAAQPTWQTLDLTYIPDAWVKKAVKAASTGNLTLSGPQTIDTVSCVAGDQVLAKNQTSLPTNGIYQVNAGAWTRVAGGDTASEIAGALVAIDQGTQGGQLWTTTFKTTDTLGTTAMNWYRVPDSSMFGVASGLATLDGSTKIPIAQIPTGTSGTTVSLGNHTHAGVYEPAFAAGTVTDYRRGDKTWQPLNFAAIAGVTVLSQMPSAGTSAQYMRGDKTWQTLNAAAVGIASDPVAGTAGLRTLGTGAQQAAAGNHTHAYQASDATLTALAGLTTVADRLPYFTGVDTAALATFTAFGRSLVDDADAAAGRTTLGLNNVANLAQVATTTDQTVAGIKTFSSSPIVPDPTTGTQAASKQYADAAVAALPAMGQEMGSATRNTTYTVAGGGPTTGVISSLSVTVTGTGRPVDIEFSAPMIYFTTANIALAVQILVGGSTTGGNGGFFKSNVTGDGPNVYVRHRKFLTNGVSYTFTVQVTTTAAGTITVYGGTDLEMQLTVTQR